MTHAVQNRLTLFVYNERYDRNTQGDHTMKHPTLIRLLCTLLALCLLCGGLVACSKGSEIPKGYQNATCEGALFRLYIPTHWTVSTESGVSGGYYSLLEGTAVSMTQVNFDLPEDIGTEEHAALMLFVAAHVEEISALKGYTPEKGFSNGNAPNANVSGVYAAKDITYSAVMGEDTYRYRQVLCKVGGNFFLFTYSAKADSFDQWLDTVDEILENIVFNSQNGYEGDGDDKKIPNVEAPDGMKLVTGNDVAYRFFVPESWVVGNAEAAALVYASETDRSNVSLLGYAAADGYSVADYWKDTEKYYKDALTDYTLTAEPAESTLGGKKATVYEYTYSLGGVSYKCRQTVCVYSYMIVVMTYTALPENYDAHLAEVEQMQSALTFRR